MSKILHILYLGYNKILSVLGVETNGVRVILYRDNNVLLVKTRYYPYWILPGGGVKKGESIQEAGKREVQEECGIIIHSFSSPLGIYTNTREGRKDTVTVLIAGLWNESHGERKRWNLEIQKSTFFDIHNLPKSLSHYTRKRIDEYLSGKRGFGGDW